MKRALVITALLLLTFTAQTSAAGNTFYIAPSGDDANPCAQLTPCKTLSRAATFARPGDSIHMRGGTYYPTAEQVLTLSGQATAPITISSYPGEWAVFDAISATIGNTSSVIRLSNSKYVTFSNAEIRNSSGRGLSVSSTGGSSHHITIDGVRLSHTGQRAIGGSGDDITIRNSLVEYASEDNTTNGSGGGWSGGVSSYNQLDGIPSHRWTLTNNTIRFIKGECAIALNVQGFEFTGNHFENCYSVYIDKATNGLVAGNVVSQTLGWGKGGASGDGFKLANEYSNLITPRYGVADITFKDNQLFGVEDCFSYWQDARNTNPTNTYTRITITGNSCDSVSSTLADFHPVGASFVQPLDNVFVANTCAGCSVTLGDTDDNLTWARSAITPTPIPTSTPAPTGQPTTAIRFAVVGDFGHESSGAADDVARLIDGWNVDFIATVGDNCYYPVGDQMDRCIGQYYQRYIWPYNGAYGPGSPNNTNRFFPTMGNHDWDGDAAPAYANFFTLPGNERYYTFRRGDVEFFMVDSDSREPDGNTSNSPQALWLRNAMAASDATWKLVLFHHPPYSTGSTHGGSPTRRWPYAQWGADVVLAGHEHNYERILTDGIVYFVNGLGGRSLYTFTQSPVPGSQVRYGANYGAMLVDADTTHITFQFITRAGQVIDSYTLTAGDVTPTPIISPTPTLTRTPTLSPTRTLTRTPTRTRTATWTPTRTPTPSRTRTATPSSTPSFTTTSSPTATESFTPTATFTSSSTTTPTATNTIGPSASPNAQTPVWSMPCPGRIEIVGGVVSCYSLGTP